jgi:tetratricopeptide (TPR) repeat protein
VVGRPGEALTAAEETVQLYRGLAADNPGHLPDLAQALTNLANRLAESGRRVEGLAAAEEAVRLYRELVEGNRDAYLPNLAGSVNNRDAYLPNLAASVNNLALRLGESGRRGEGLTAAQEAVALRRELVESHRDAYLPDLATSVNNLALRLAEEAAQLYRELVAENPAIFGPRAEQAGALAVSLSEDTS